MNLDLKTYVKIYSERIKLETCEKIVTNLQTTSWTRHSFHNPKDNTEKTYDTDLEITCGLSNWDEVVHEKIWKAVEEYVVKDFNFSWFNGWTGFTQVRYNKYEIGMEMQQHCDHIHSMFDGSRKGIPVLTVLGGLNDNYEGGELVMWENEVIKLKAGDIMVFPSNFLYPHKVMPVTKGTRYSYVSWVW